MTDSVLKLAQDHVAVDNQALVDFGLKFSGVLAHTPKDRIERAIGDEIADLVRRARAGIQALGPEVLSSDAGERALVALASEQEFPRATLDEIAAHVRANGGPAALAGEIDAWTARHKALEHRVGWLLNGTRPKRRATLDPHADADELNHIVTSAFRFESRVVETLAINRIAQAPSLGSFFRSTKEAELNSVMRFFDTYALYSNVFEWGVDSFRARTALARMNQIHGRYYIPNDEMKFVLLQGAFTWLDGVDRIGHRRVSDLERRGMLVSWVRMGKGMNIQNLTENYEEMYQFYREICLATADFKPYKRDTFETIVTASVSGQLPSVRDGLLLASRVAMDDTFRTATGYDEPNKAEIQAVRAVFFTVGSFIESLPYTPYLRSLQNTPVRRTWHEPHELGTSTRSVHMPTAFAHLPNGGLPEGQVPLSSLDDAMAADLPDMDWDEVKKRANAGRLVMVVDGFVYDLTTMREVHPGGSTILRRWAGKDATRPYNAAKHTNGSLVFSLNFRIGRVVGTPPEPPNRDEMADVAEARELHRKSGSFAALGD